MRAAEKISPASLIPAWLAGSLITFFVLGFLKNFYSYLWQLALWGLFIQTLGVLFLYYLFLRSAPRFVWQRHWLLLAILLLAVLFSLSIIWLVNQFPRWFDASLFLTASGMLPWFIGVVALSPAWIVIIILLLSKSGCESRMLSSPWYTGLLGNLPGIFLATTFLGVYFVLAVAYSPLLRDPPRNVDDNFYDADPTSWMNRFAGPVEDLIEMRPVHPFSFLIFRSLTWLVGLLLNGSRFYAALLLNSAAGGLCVFLAWSFVKRWSNATFAAIVASLMGLTASHLVFATFLETYIFSAAALIAFLLVLARPDRRLRWLVPSGLLIFGITISNFVQTLILFIASEFNLVKIARYVLTVVLLAFALAWMQSSIYPSSQPFYDPAQMVRERRYDSSINNPERARERAYTVARTMLLYSTVGPRPLALLEEVGCIFPCFKTYMPQYGDDLITSYAGFGSWLARIWFAILLTAGGLFVYGLFHRLPHASLQAGLAMCLLFNLVLHIVYGDDPMLYSPDWTYALIFFAGLSFRDLAEKRWLQIAAFAFLIGLAINNWHFLRSMLIAVEPFL